MTRASCGGRKRSNYRKLVVLPYISAYLSTSMATNALLSHSVADAGSQGVRDKAQQSQITDQRTRNNAMCTTNWTYGDLARLTWQALQLDPPPYNSEQVQVWIDDDSGRARAEQAYIDNTVFCAHCSVAPALAYDDYCGACLDALVEKLAEQWQEDTAMSIYR